MLSNMPFITGPELGAKQSSQYALPTSKVISIYPMTRVQEGLWLAYSMAPHHTLYNLTLKLTLVRNPVKSTIFSAINVLTRRHSILRSTFHDADETHGKPFIAERDPIYATPVLQVVTKPDTSQAETMIQSLLRTAVDLSSTFAIRWFVVLGTSETDLFLVSHHIALDGKSMSQLSIEIFALLEDSGFEARGNRPEPFYRAHMIEAAFLDSPSYHAAKAFWVRQLRNVRPIKWKDVSARKYSAEKNYYREIDTWFTFSNAELRDWGNRYQTSWFRVAIALIGVLVRSIAIPDGISDHAITIAFGGRPAEMKNTVGQFANAVPIRIPLIDVICSQSPTFEALVRLISKEVSTAKNHDQFSYLDLTEACSELGLQVPSTQVAITQSPKLARPECTLYPVEGSYDLFFCFSEGEETVSLGTIYNPLLFSNTDIVKMKTAFSELYKLTTDQTPLKISSLSAMKFHIPGFVPDLDLNNSDQVNAGRFHIWFEHRASQCPEFLALHSGEQGSSVTYQDLNEEANRKAHYLRKIGVSRGSIVLVHLARGFCIIEWIIATLKSGAAFAVADQTHPVLRTQSVISIAQPALIVDDGNGKNLTEYASHVNVLDVRNLTFDDMPTGNIEDITQNDDLACIVFTSGSTGQPKGVEIEHRNLSHCIAGVHSSGYVLISPGSRVLQFATFAFDAAIFEWSQCLTFGGTLCFADMPHALVGNYLADVIDSNQISFLHLTPSVLTTLPTSRTLPSLQQISVGGEMVSENVISAWRTRVQVTNAYGPTECAIVVSHYSEPRFPEKKQPLAGLVGLPHPHMKAVVSNYSFTRLLPPNKVGEVCIGGPQVGRGYRGRDDLTANRFAIHPELGERLYRTGDRGKLLPDGTLLLLGRIDREVKVRGKVIELDDVEQTILSIMPQIRSVSVQPDETGLSLCAFVSPKGISGDLLKNSLSERLPSYMIPSSVFSLDRLPLNTNGKTDHKVIRATMGNLIAKARQPHRTLDSFPLRTHNLPNSGLSGLEMGSELQNITQIWKGILNLPQSPALSSNFFDLGGNSILVQTLANSLKTAFNLSNLRVVDLFSHATLLAQAKLVTDRANSTFIQRLQNPIPRLQKQLPSDSHVQAEQNIVSSYSLNSDIAIVGIAGRFPSASNPDEFFQMLLEGRDGITTFSQPASGVMPWKDAIHVPKRGIIPGLNNFDRARWGLTENEARDMDPQQRLFLEVTREALEDSGISPSSDGNTNIGLCVGAGHSTWNPSTDSTQGDDFNKTHRSLLTPCISARTAYHLNLQGPNVTLNTACSSGLVAMSTAIDHLRSKKCDTAIAGGVSITFPQQGYYTSKDQLLSPSGYCRPFDYRADGTVPGDAVCAVVLRRLEDAVRDGDRIYSVVSGIATRSDGSIEKATPTAPSPRGQANTIIQAWKDSGLSASELVYAELHGSGTPIGDALELEGLDIARAELKADMVPISVGSNKGNVGNCEAAGGLVSVIKICKSMEYGAIPAMPAFQGLHPMINPNPFITIAASELPLSPNAIVSVSSIGLGGVNAHCVLRFPPSSNQQPLEFVKVYNWQNRMA
ncbi:hypothetical protein GALMADRAFT_130449 [Galerina marginata CBS 339.88]|uniref:Uncharacterized protein n=1 Tax=Galerina marginata (strain CBS 339.88) TaxID=685588 RepID=A0A067S8Q3_GALM3|nr:hypothetical protein GALMADRAFT_130449 [Galerina marginata CBS 339.88]